NATMSPSMVINIAHHPTAFGPEMYSGKLNPSPTSFSAFSGIWAVPVHSQMRIVINPNTAQASVSHHKWNVPKINTPPTNAVANRVRKVGPGILKHWIG